MIKITNFKKLYFYKKFHYWYNNFINKNFINSYLYLITTIIMRHLKPV